MGEAVSPFPNVTDAGAGSGQSLGGSLLSVDRVVVKTVIVARGDAPLVTDVFEERRLSVLLGVRWKGPRGDMSRPIDGVRTSSLDRFSEVMDELRLSRCIALNFDATPATGDKDWRAMGESWSSSLSSPSFFLALFRFRYHICHDEVGSNEMEVRG